MIPNPKPEVEGGTKVVSMLDAEPGVVMNGFAWLTETGEWVEYEVQTEDGIERWNRSEFLTMAEIEQLAKEAEAEA